MMPNITGESALAPEKEKEISISLIIRE